MQFLYPDTGNLPSSLGNAIQLQELLVKYKIKARIIIVYHPPAGILLAYNVYTRTRVKYKTATRITSSIHSIKNFWYVKTFLVSKYNPNVIFVAQILGIYKVCKLPYILKAEFYLLQGHIFLGNVSSLLVMTGLCAQIRNYWCTHSRNQFLNFSLESLVGRCCITLQFLKLPFTWYGWQIDLNRLFSESGNRSLTVLLVAHHSTLHVSKGWVPAGDSHSLGLLMTIGWVTFVSRGIWAGFGGLGCSPRCWGKHGRRSYPNGTIGMSSSAVGSVGGERWRGQKWVGRWRWRG